MPYLLTDLVINRVDFVDEGADSAAFIELIKRKEKDGNMTVQEILAKMKPEHREAIEAEISAAKEEVSKAKTAAEEATQRADTAEADLAKAKEDLAKACGAKDSKVDKECEGEEKDPECKEGEGKTEDSETEKAKSGSSFDETEVIKSMPKAAQELFKTLKAQKEAAEEEVRKAKDAEEIAKARQTAKSLKAIPVEEDVLVGILKSADQNVIDVLTTAAEAIGATVLSEVGKSKTSDDTSADAWSKIEAKANEISKSTGMTLQKAISQVVKENPGLYKEYLEGGAN